jgi:D-alanine-D-alanine ligase
VKIGLTYDLRDDYLAAGYTEEETAEFDRLSTIEAIEGALRARGHQTDRIGHAAALVRRLADGDRWDLVFNIAEGLHGIGREAQVPALLETFGIPYTFGDPLVMSLSLHKGMAKRVLRDAGVPTPDFAEIAELSDLADLQLRYPLFAKPLAEGTGKGIDAGSVINDPDELAARCSDLLERFHQPVLVETFLPGRELTVAVLGSGDAARVLGTMEITLLSAAEANAYTYVNKEFCEELVRYTFPRAESDALVAEAERVALRAWRVLGCRDAGRIDLRADTEGAPQVMEINPLAGLHPDHSDLPMIATSRGLAYADLIDGITRSAARRRGEIPARRKERFHACADPA